MEMMKLGKALVLAASVAVVAGCSTTGGGEAGQVEQGQGTTPAGGAVTSGVETSGVSGLTTEQQNLLKDKVYHFKFDSSEISDQDRNALDAHAKYLTSPEGRKEHIIIQGHTDERGSAEYNLALGERRANAVANYLESLGVNKSQIEVVSYGEEDPVDPASNEEAWAKNRRAVIAPSSADYGK